MKYSEDLLDRMRMKTDDDADAAIRALCKARKINEVRKLLDQLVFNDDVPDLLPAEIQSFWKSSLELARRKGVEMKGGEKFFAEHGPEIVLILGFYSLPMDYAARGVRVLWATGELFNNTTRRVFETMQMVIDVMKPGGLAANGRGLATALKVRLMHAAIRA